MSLLIISQAEVAQLLPMDRCIGLMRDAFTSFTRGEAVLPLRPVLKLPDERGVLAMMPAYLASNQTLAIKVITVFPKNLDTPFDSHQGAVLLFDEKDGRMIALMDASEITSIRTAAASGVATDLLARTDAHDLAILGSGVEARTHLEAMIAVRRISRVRVWSRRAERATAFAKRESARHDITIEVFAEVADTVSEADLICTTTGASEPVLCGPWIAAGAHVNAVGSATPWTRELDTAAVVNSRLFVDSFESAINEAGDFLIPRKEGAITDDHIMGEIGDLLLKRVAGRTSDNEITLFKSLGIAVQDVAAGRHVYQMALESGMGTSIELGGLRDQPA